MLEYFKELLYDELHGAEEYVKNALEFKSTYPNWAKTFLEMSATELEHASNIYKMADASYHDTISSYNTAPEYLEKLWKSMLDKYAEKTAKVKYMHEMFNK